MNPDLKKHFNIVEKCFSEAASTYDSVADIQRQSSQLLVALIDHSWQINSVIDIGCGTGGTSLMLFERYPRASYTLCDISPAMLQQARRKFPSSVKLLCADAEKHNFSETYDLGISNMSLQWFGNIGQFFSKILKNCSVFAFSTLMSGSFQSYGQLFEVPPTFIYPTKNELLDICTKSGHVINYQTKRYIKKCANMFAVSRYFRKLGAHMKSQNVPILRKNIDSSIPISLEYDVFFAILTGRKSSLQHHATA